MHIVITKFEPNYCIWCNQPNTGPHDPVCPFGPKVING